MHRAPLLLAFVAALAGLLASSCGTLAYNRAWERFQPVGEGDPMEGRWKGEWRSERDGHSGGLRCMMTREGDGADGPTYRARFHSTYGWIFFFRHETLFRVVGEEEEGTLRFEGSEDLGKTFGGVYHYEGTVAESSFRARYQAENGDHGVFEMRRLD